MTSTAASERPASPRKLLAWLPTLLWLCTLAAFSTDLFSAEHTGGLLLRIIHAVYGRISPHRFYQIHFFVRKSAHFLSYGFLSALAFFSWRATFPGARSVESWAARPRWSLRWAALGVLTAFIAGGLDELHQSFVPSRGSSLHDVLIDTAGAICFQLAVLIFRKNSTT